MTRVRRAHNPIRQASNGNPVRFYARLKFRKLGRLRYLSHLDLARCFDRAVRRAELPVSYTEGFSPRAKIAFASALGVGVGGAAELCAVDLERRMPATDLMERLNRQLPNDLQVLEAAVEVRAKRSPFAAISRACYEIVLDITPESATELLPAAVAAVLASPEIVITRETKSRVAPVDIRPGILQLAVMPDEPRTIGIELSIAEGSLVKPAEVVATLQSLLSGMATAPVEVRMAENTRTALLE